MEKRETTASVPTQKWTPHQKTILQRKLIESEIVARAWVDKTFRDKLETHPVEALAEMGISLPEQTTLRVIDETSDTLTLVIPPVPHRDEEISEEELETVAGGLVINLPSKPKDPYRFQITNSYLHQLQQQMGH